MRWNLYWCKLKHAQTCLYYDQVAWLPSNRAFKSVRELYSRTMYVWCKVTLPHEVDCCCCMHSGQVAPRRVHVNTLIGKHGRSLQLHLAVECVYRSNRLHKSTVHDKTLLNNSEPLRLLCSKWVYLSAVMLLFFLSSTRLVSCYGFVFSFRLFSERPIELWSLGW
jgi:hypothetical protein